MFFCSAIAIIFFGIRMFSIWQIGYFVFFHLCYQIIMVVGLGGRRYVGWSDRSLPVCRQYRWCGNEDQHRSRKRMRVDRKSLSVSDAVDLEIFVNVSLWHAWLSLSWFIDKLLLSGRWCFVQRGWCYHHGSVDRLSWLLGERGRGRDVEKTPLSRTHSGRSPYQRRRDAVWVRQSFSCW